MQTIRWNTHTVFAQGLTHACRMSTSCLTTCAQCGSEGIGLLRCSRCKQAAYCHAVCQKAHWQAHKLSCKKCVTKDQQAVSEAGATASHVQAASEKPLCDNPPARIKETSDVQQLLDSQKPGGDSMWCPISNSAEVFTDLCSKLGAWVALSSQIPQGPSGFPRVLKLLVIIINNTQE